LVTTTTTTTLDLGLGLGLIRDKIFQSKQICIDRFSNMAASKQPIVARRA
jgi:hypothetical protein